MTVATAGRGSEPRVATLFVAPQVPWPLDVGSKIRTFNLLRSYAELGDVTLVCLAQSEAEAAAVSGLGDHIVASHVIPVTGAEAHPKALRRLWAMAETLLNPVPRVIRYFSSPVLAATVDELVATDRFDVIHVERVFMMANVKVARTRSRRPRRPLYLLDIDDLESAKAMRAARLAPWESSRRYLGMLEAWRLRRFERSVAPRMDCNLVCSELDGGVLQRWIPEAVTRVFRNGTELVSTDPARGTTDDRKTIVFLGAMDYWPNEDAVLYFMEAMFPYIVQTIPDVRFIIAGKAPSDRIRRLHDGRQVLVTGYVHDKEKLFRETTVFVVPLRVGGGTRLKILEAMAWARPVLSTSIGSEGIDATDRENIVLADTPTRFVASCCELLANEALREQIGQNGSTLVRGSYVWSGIRSEYANWVRAQVSMGGVYADPSARRQSSHDGKIW